MLISEEQKALIGQVFETYLAELHHDDILQLIADDNEETHHPVVVNAMTLFEASMEVGDYFNAYPSDVLAIFDKVLQRTAQDLSQNVSLRHRGERTEVKSMRHIFHTRITGLPVCSELTRETIPRSRDVGHFLSVTGTVIRTSVAKILEYERDYMCQKCRHVFSMQTEFEQFYVFAPPLTCPNPGGCNSYKFSCLSGGSEPAACKDYQEIKIQEQVQRLSVGSIPRSMVVVLEDDLVDRCKSGDDVTIYGVVCQRWKPFYEGVRSDVELVIKANNIEVNNQQTSAAMLSKEIQQEFEAFWTNYKHDPIAGRNQILLSLCPQVFGMYVIKLAVAMVLAGGVQRIDPSGTKIRGECHMLLVGDPGTGKSQFLKYSAKIMPRSVLTAGIGSTSAGLTVAAVRDAGEWHLEAGALVLSDGGLCCIDEFNSIKEHDRISIHEAMEQQSISVAKAGMVCKLNTRTTILAATNPKGQYNPDEPLSVNVALASPLLSRFDLVLVLLDTRNSEWDNIISSFILENRGLCAETSDLWPMEKMKAYFSAIKHLQPQMSQEANSILSRYYQLQRQSDGRNAARTTIRMLESLSRLAEAHARLMYRETVTIQDAVMAVSVMECSMQGGALLGNVNTLLTSFPAEPGQQYEAQCKVLLEGLNLPLLLQKEMDRLARLNINVPDASPPQSPIANCQHPCRETNKTDLHDITGDGHVDTTVLSGLDWFHSITSPPSTDVKASTVTVHPNCGADEATQKDSCSRFTCKEAVFSSPFAEVADESKKTEYINEDGFRNKAVDKPGKPNDEQHSECVVQTVSRNLRDKRLSQLELNDPPCNKVWEYGESPVSGGANKIVADVLNTASKSNRGNLQCSEKGPLTKPVAKNNRSCGKKRKLEEIEQMNQMETKNESRQKKTADANTTKDLHAQLSDFTFKPRKSLSLIHERNFSASSNLSVETTLNPDRRTGKQKLSKCNETARLSSEAEENKRNENQNQNLIEVECSSKCLKSAESSFSKVEGSEMKTGFMSRQLVNVSLTKEISINNTDDTTVNFYKHNPTINASPKMSDSAPGHTKSTIIPSTLAKLSKFSFTSITKPTTSAQEHVLLSPSSVVETFQSKRNILECLETTSDVKKMEASPEHCSLTKKIKKLVAIDKVNTVPVSTVAVPSQGKGFDRERQSPTNCKAKQTELPAAAKRIMTDEPVENELSVKKRKSFELPSTSGNFSKGLFPGLSLFGSVEVNNDVFDTDWDQELS